MRKALTEAGALNSERNGYAHATSASTYRLAKKLEEVSSGDYAEVTLGKSFREWVTSLRDENGRPRTYTWAKNLMRQLNKIRQHPQLVKILEQQVPDDAAGFIAFSSAFYVAKLAEEDNWLNKVVAEMRGEGVERSEWETVKAQKMATLFYRWGTKSTREIRDRIDEVRGDKRDEETPRAWPHHGGRVDPDVKERYDSALARLSALQEAGDVGTMSYTRELEVLGVGVNELLDALEAATKGDSTQLRSWLEQIAGE